MEEESIDQSVDMLFQILEKRTSIKSIEVEEMNSIQELNSGALKKSKNEHIIGNFQDSQNISKKKMNLNKNAVIPKQKIHETKNENPKLVQKTEKEKKEISSQNNQQNVEKINQSPKKQRRRQMQMKIYKFDDEFQQEQQKDDQNKQEDDQKKEKNVVEKHKTQRRLDKSDQKFEFMQEIYDFITVKNKKLEPQEIERIKGQLTPQQKSSIEYLLTETIGKKGRLYEQLHKIGIYLPEIQTRFVTQQYLVDILRGKEFFLLKKNVKFYFQKIKESRKELTRLLYKKLRSMEYDVTFSYRKIPDKKWLINILYTIFPECYIFKHQFTTDYLQKCPVLYEFLDNVVPSSKTHISVALQKTVLLEEIQELQLKLNKL